MNGIHQVASLVFAAGGSFLVYQGFRLRLDGQLGPGPGFFPFWIGLAICGLSFLWLVQVSKAPASEIDPDFLPSRSRGIGLLLVLAAMVAFMLLLRPIGFNLAMLGLLLFLFFAIDRKFVLAKLAIALIASFGLHWVFEKVLKVPLP